MAQEKRHDSVIFGGGAAARCRHVGSRHCQAEILPPARARATRYRRWLSSEHTANYKSDGHRSNLGSEGRCWGPIIPQAKLTCREINDRIKPLSGLKDRLSRAKKTALAKADTKNSPLGSFACAGWWHVSKGAMHVQGYQSRPVN